MLLPGIVFLNFSGAFGADIDFSRDIRPILSDKCFSCHGPDEEHRKAKLRLDLREDAFADKDGVMAFHAGNLEKSEAWHRIDSSDPDEVMPPPKYNKPVTESEKKMLREWIESGAEWKEHWSFVAPERPETPKSKLHPIDAFVRAGLDKGLEPSPEADKRTLIRRITFDLTGLPPTREEVQAFVGDTSPEAYEKVVDRLLSSQAYGQRMALMWLDAARYGDTSVMHADGPRDMWPWRDWVVNAYNQNQPFDQFSIEQLAGDLLPEPTNEQLIATGFNRNHPSSDEGGAIAEELRVGYVVDRVKTTANVWLGLSMECAQCHDHKYDAISQKEYFQFYAYFNNTADPGMQTRKGNQAPFVEVVTDIEEDKLNEIDKKLTNLTKKVGEAKSKALAANAAPGDKEPAADVEKRVKNLKHFYPLDDVIGNLLVDAKGSKDATGEKPITPVFEGKNGRGIQLEGGKVYDAPGITEFDNKSKFTLSAWIKLAKGNEGGAVISKMDVANSHRGYDLWMQGGKPGIHIINKWPSNALKVVAEQKLTPGEWQHVAVTYNGGGKPESVKIYINGKVVPHSVEAKRLTGTIKNDVPFRIGGRSEGANFTGEVDDIHIYDRHLTHEEISWAMEDLVKEAQSTVAEKRTPAQKTISQGSQLAASPEYGALRTQQLRTELEKVELLRGKTTTMVMEDNPADKMRMTYVLNRGQYDSPVEDEAILPGTPAALPPLPDDAPENRLGLARWLFADNHPLTSRVAANQLWQIFFGSGIVTTPADFGAQGAFPTHPKLLDWLAVEFRESGWDVKAMVRQIVLSKTYRQSSNVRPHDIEVDPDNRYLARAPRFRLQAEMIRDNALMLSGLLGDKASGPGVKPYQPSGLWAEVGLGGNPKFVQDHGEKLYQKTLYTYWKRSAPPPAMVIFDAPNRETCVIKRPITNTPLQALAAMNDVQMLEASRHFAERLMKEGGKTPEARASWAFETATSRTPESGELAALLEIHQYGFDEFSTEPDKAKSFLGSGESDRDESLNVADHAAWTVVASTILNLDEVLTRN